MGIFFSKKKPQSRVTEQDKAVLQLKQTRDKIKQYQKRIEQSIEKEREIAKQLIHDGKKDRALLLLRKKKFQEQLLSKTDGQLENLEHMMHDLEFAQIELKVIDGLKVGNTALKKLHDILSIEDIEKVMDETREGIEKQKELDDVLSGTLSDEDEGEAEAELEALLAQDRELQDKEEEKTKIPEVPKEVSLPDVPTDEPVKQRESPRKEKIREAVPLEA
ncbi:charged multivesicular body protein 6 [Neodiprion virginianus]|uniref:Charged multivesicular body protein 6 n=1 Tax=Neodiprion lecontei TaxID=441921 RepID=A0A6J0CBU9_NEOLC|nr:charged multivesicular body protein 6 [Neodiprion lecontei]XP_046428030.1 charged multivesicular body protein 6 [Neodiprion fabricii]XP_046621917.1 charged multivesicular body protein 6 [Neodiprion virginianus]